MLKKNYNNQSRLYLRLYLEDQKCVDMSWHRRIVCWIYQFEIYGNNLEFGFIFIRNTGLHTHPAKLGKDVDVSFATLQ
jgi:hypothetical protein